VQIRRKGERVRREKWMTIRTNKSIGTQTTPPTESTRKGSNDKGNKVIEEYKNKGKGI
jgi:hypothetical protein